MFKLQKKAVKNWAKLTTENMGRKWDEEMWRNALFDHTIISNEVIVFIKRNMPKK